jgi:hypothetical protein
MNFLLTASYFLVFVLTFITYYNPAGKITNFWDVKPCTMEGKSETSVALNLPGCEKFRSQKTPPQIRRGKN